MTKKSVKRAIVPDKIRVLGSKGSGSVIAEAFLTLANVPYIFENIDGDINDNGEIDGKASANSRQKLFNLNPLGEVPTLILSDGSVLTQTLAIATYADEMDQELRLIPSKGGSDYTAFWRWALFIVAAIYPTFTYGDSPERWVAESNGAARSLRESTDEWRKRLWIQIEDQASSPYFLGSGFSAIDIYLAVMSHWRPGLDWFQQRCPKIAFIAKSIESEPHLSELFTRNF